MTSTSLLPAQNAAWLDTSARPRERSPFPGQLPRPLADAVLADMREGVVITAADGTIVAVNRAFEAITGYSEAEAVGRTPAMLASGRHDPAFYKALWHAIHTAGSWEGDIWNRRRDGRVYAERLRIAAQRDAHGAVSHYVGWFSDITAQKHQQEALDRMAHYDGLTGLPNRSLMIDRLVAQIDDHRRDDLQLALCFLDLDGFRDVNEQFGKDAGNALLLQAAERLRHLLRPGDTVSRVGGDEFALLLRDVGRRDDLDGIVQRLVRAINDPFELPQGRVQVSASVGVALYPTHGTTPEHLLRNADHAMYEAKHHGKNRACWAHHGEDLARARDADRQRVRTALQARELFLQYQPKVNALSGLPVGAEALVRWRHPDRGTVAPGEFLPLLAGTELEVDLDLWVLEQAMHQLARWQRHGLDLVMCVNVSAPTLTLPDFVDRLLLATERTGAHIEGRLELEVVESAALKDIRGAVLAMQACARHGVRFALDDFGTGYSSLAYLRQLPVSALKIDQSFVRRMLDDPNDMHIVKAVIGLAGGFNVRTVAEGVETDRQAQALSALGCDALQGYGISRPLDADLFLQWVHDASA